MGKFNRGGDRRDFGDRDRNRGFGNSTRGPRQMFQATCSECGNDCEIPFEPRAGRPVFCSRCFEKQGNSSFSRPEKRGDNRPSFGDKRMFEAVCDTCGRKCEVPFRPSGEKPVYCNQCFGKGDKPKNNPQDPMKEQVIKLNSKLDKILEILNFHIVAKAVAKKKPAEKIKEPEKVKHDAVKPKIKAKKAKSKKKK